MNRKEFFLIKRLASSIVDVVKVQYKNIDFTCCSCLKPSINHLDNTCRQYSMLTGKLFSLKDDYKILFMFFVIDDFSSNSLLFHKCSSLQTIYFNILTSNNKWLHEFFKGYVNIKKQKEIDLMRRVFNNVFSLLERLFCKSISFLLSIVLLISEIFIISDISELLFFYTLILKKSRNYVANY